MSENGQNTENGYPFFHPARRPYRFTVLFFTSLLTLGSYFAYDSVGAMENALMGLLHIHQSAIGAMYTMYSIAAILSVFLGGILADRIGTRWASLLFSLLVTFGASIVALAPSLHLPGRGDLYVLYTGRLIFGWGSESLVVVQSAILARWFKGKELAMAFGVALTLSRLGTLFSFNTEAFFAQHFGPVPALWIASGLCTFSLVANVVYIFLDLHGERVLNLPTPEAGDSVKLSDIKFFDARFWYVTMLCVTFYSAIFPFTALSTDLFHEKWHLPLSVAHSSQSFLSQVFSNFAHMFSTAPGTTSIIIFASMLTAPFAGALVDRIGRRASLMVLGALLMIPAHLMIGFTYIPPAYSMSVLGVAFVLVPAAMWPSIPLIVEEKRVGTAYGLMTMLQNMGLATFPYINGKLREVTHGYKASMGMFASLGLVGLVFALLLLIADKKHGGVLERAD